MKNTIDMQNIISRLEKELYLGYENPTSRIKQKFATVRKKFIELHLALDRLNDELEQGE